jgi:hypothetical protein
MAHAELEFIDSALILRKVARSLLDAGSSDAEIDESLRAWTDSLTLTVAEMLNVGDDGQVNDGGAAAAEAMASGDLDAVDEVLTLRGVAKRILEKGSSVDEIEGSILAWTDALALTVVEMRRQGSGDTTNLYGVNY